ncbi:MAG: acyl-CoA thioesterase [Acidihalobacter sp.]|uniref:acyl-CoA thioesterase n=1 Tax=Acidihalobacter sp. TaxID=1872108 RepID=UPI00307E0B8C
MRDGKGLFGGIEPVLRVPARPGDINAGGDIFGGWIMSQIDIAGSIPAVARSGGRVVTVAVDHLVFMKPVKVGDIVSLYAKLLGVGRTSMKIGVEVYVHRGLQDPEFIQVSEATLTYVAVDGEGAPRVVPPQAD